MNERHSTKKGDVHGDILGSGLKVWNEDDDELLEEEHPTTNKARKKIGE